MPGEQKHVSDNHMDFGLASGDSGVSVTGLHVLVLCNLCVFVNLIEIK